MTDGPLRRWDGSAWGAADARPIPEEAAVAIVIDGASQAVLMATPHYLRDFATGFALTEGLIASPADITGFEQVTVAPATDLALAAVEARLWLRPGLAAGLAERRRAMVGPVGCGLCGVDSIAAAMDALSAGQVLWRATPSIHAACLWTPGGALVREDVGRHNALDKLAGAAARAGADPRAGIVAMTSRISVDLVQKAARMGAPVLAGAGVPTRLAVAWAEAAGMTLIGRARDGAFDLFTHPARIEP